MPRTQSFWSCQTSAGLNLCNCSSSSRGRDTGQYATPSYPVGGIKIVYRCQVEGCREGPSTSMPPSVCTFNGCIWDWGWCAPSAVNLFSILTLSDTTKKSFKHVNRGSHVWGSVNIWWVGGSHPFFCISSIIFICIIAHLTHLVVRFCIFVKLFKFYKEILYIR